MGEKMKFRYLALLLCFAVFSGNVKAEKINIAALQGLGAPSYHLIKAQKPKQNYHIFVRTPAKYDRNKVYPTVYLLDGGITFPLLASYYHYHSFTELMPEMIIVGISYGADTFKQGNGRSRDFTAKSVERDYWGGAPEFANVLKTQIFPMVEQHYRSDASNRVIFGQSLGGQFVLYCAMKEPGMFKGHIASNPALHRNLDYFMQDIPTPKKPKGKLPVLFVSDGEFDDVRFKKPALKWIKHWTAKTDLPWRFKTSILKGQNHMSAAPEAFRQGIHFIFQ